jgi:precorrin-6B methylase 2
LTFEKLVLSCDGPYDMTAAMRTFTISVLFGSLLIFGAGGVHGDYPEEIPFVPTPIEVIAKMLELAEVKEDDVLYDLGSGDGRIVIRAAQKYGIHAVGIEMDQSLQNKARSDAQAAGVAHLVVFRVEDALKADISSASVITLYMLPWFNEKIKPNLRQMLKPGSRIVAHDFGIEGWEPDRSVKLPGYEFKIGGYKHQHTLYLWQIKAVTFE